MATAGGIEERPFEDFYRQVSLSLVVSGGRVFARHATSTHPEAQTIELKARLRRSYTGPSVTIGSHKHGEEIGWKLDAFPFGLTIHQLDDEWFAKSASIHDGEEWSGQIRYSDPINTSDGMVRQKWPSVETWLGVGPETFKLIRDRLITTDEPDFMIGITIQFPVGAVEPRMGGSIITWDGKEPLRITEGSIVWSFGDHDIDRDPQDEPEEEPAGPSPEHLELVSITNRIEQAVGKLLIPAWVAAAGIIALALWHH